jgi:hypothetical protein
MSPAASNGAAPAPSGGDQRLARAEIARIARLLRREPVTLAYLEAVPLEDLRRLREQVTEVLFGPSWGALDRLATASKLLPVGLVATLAEKVFGAVLSARIAGLLDPGRAAHIAAKLPTPFLADVAVELDPRRAEALLARIPPERVAEIARELLGRGEHVAMASFIGHLELDAIRAAAEALDGGTLLRLAVLLDQPETVQRLLDVIGFGRLEQAIDAAERESLWPEALLLLEGLDGPRRAALIALASARDGLLDGLIAAARREHLWGAVLPLTAELEPAALERLAALAPLREPVALREITDLVVARPALAGALVPVLALLPARSQAVVVARLKELGAGGLMLEQARAAGMLDQLGPLAAQLS